MSDAIERARRGHNDQIKCLNCHKSISPSRNYRGRTARYCSSNCMKYAWKKRNKKPAPLIRCVFCGNAMTKWRRKKYCSIDCRMRAQRVWRATHPKPTARYLKHCIYCGTPFVCFRKSTKYCQPKCLHNAWNHAHHPGMGESKSGICLWCSKQFTYYGFRKYCSAECRQCDISHRWRITNPEKARAVNKKAGPRKALWYKTIKGRACHERYKLTDTYKATRKRAWASRVRRMPDGYIRSLLTKHRKIERSKITPELIEIKRNLVKFNRALKMVKETVA